MKTHLNEFTFKNSSDFFYGSSVLISGTHFQNKKSMAEGSRILNSLYCFEGYAGDSDLFLSNGRLKVFFKLLCMIFVIPLQSEANLLFVLMGP